MAAPSDDDADYAEESLDFAEEAVGDEDEYAAEGGSASDSQLDFGAEASTDDDEYEEDYDGPAVYDADDFADDAGDDASYGMEAAHVSFKGSGDVEGLGGDSGMDEYDDEYAYASDPSASDPDLNYADESVIDATAEGYAPDSAVTGGEVAGFADEAEVDDLAPDFGSMEDSGLTAEEPETVEDADVTGFTDEEQEDEAPAAPPSSALDDDRRSGQVAKSALDEIFARAAQIKRDRTS